MNRFKITIALLVLFMVIILAYVTMTPGPSGVSTGENTSSPEHTSLRDPAAGSMAANRLPGEAETITIRLSRKNHEAPLATAYQVDQKDNVVLTPPSSHWAASTQELQNARLLRVFFSDEPPLEYSAASILATAADEAMLECPPLVNARYRFFDLPEKEEITLTQTWNSQTPDDTSDHSILPLPLMSETVVSTTTPERIHEVPMRVGSLLAIASASQGAFVPPERNDTITEGKINPDLSFQYHAGATLDVQFRKTGEDTIEPPKIRSVRTQKVYTSSLQPDQSTYRFTGLSFEDYEFITRPEEIFVPLNSYLLFDRGKEKTIIRIASHYHAIQLCRVHITPVILTLENGWDSSELSFSLQPQKINGQWDDEFNIGLAGYGASFKVTFDPFQKSKKVNILSGEYECIVLATTRDGHSERMSYHFPKLTFSVPKQTEPYEVNLQFPDSGSIKGIIDTTYFDTYTARVYPADVNFDKFVNPPAVASSPVEKDSFFITFVPEGDYRIQLSAINSGRLPLSHSFHVTANQTTPVEITTNMGELGEFSCRIADFKGRPIRNSRIYLRQQAFLTFGQSDQNSPIQLKQQAIVTFGQSDEDGNVVIPYHKKLDSTAEIIIMANRGVILPDDGGKQLIDLQKDQGKEIRFEHLTRFRFFVQNSEGVPIRSYFLQFKHKYKKFCPSVEFFVKDSDGWGEIEALPKRETKIYGKIQGAQAKNAHGGLPPQYSMTHNVEDDVQLQITIPDPKEYTFRFFNEQNQPIPNVSVFQFEKYKRTRRIPRKDWPHKMMKSGYRSNSDGEIRILSTPAIKNTSFLFYDELYGLGYLHVAESTPLEQDIYLQDPARLSLQNSSLRTNPSFVNYISIQIPPETNPLFFHIWLHSQHFPLLKFQPGHWRFALTSTQEEEIFFYSCIKPSMLEDVNLQAGSPFTLPVVVKKRIPFLNVIW